MPRPKKIKSPEDFGKEFEKLKITKPTPYDNMPCGNPYIEEKEVEEDEQTIHAKEEHDTFLETTFTQENEREKDLAKQKAVRKAFEAFCQNPNRETEKELYERSRELGRAIGGGITIFGDREMTEKVCEELKKYDNQMGKTDLSDLPETKFEKATKEAIKEGTALEELQELEKKLRACTDETPRDIRYKIECNRFILMLQYNSIEVRGDVFYPEMLKGIYIDFRKSELSTAQKMLEVLKEWRGE